MYFSYLKDDTVTSGGGLTEVEVKLFNANVEKTRLYNQPPNKTSPVVIQPACHFVLVVNENNVPTIVLDYIFKNPDPPPPPPTSGGAALRKGYLHIGLVVRSKILTDGESPNALGMAPLGKTMGPLTIANIGLQYKSGFLSITLDASLQLGPIELTLIGLSLGVKLSDGFDLSKLPPTLKPPIDGVTISFNKPPVVMAGLFEYKGPMYIDGLSVAVDPYLFQAHLSPSKSTPSTGSSTNPVEPP
jgi:hypothetical protein